MTEGTWDDYVEVEAIDTSDPSTAVPQIADAVNDFADDTAVEGGVSDLDQVSLETAGDQADLAAADQSWSDWNGDWAAESADSATDWADYGAEQLSQGNVEIAENAFEAADRDAAFAADKLDVSATGESSVAEQLESSVDSLESVDYSMMDSTTDSGLDSGADTSLDTGFDSGADFSTDTSTDY